MTRPYGSQSMVAALRTVLVKRPDAAFAVDDPSAWHYTGRPDMALAQQEHDALVALLRQGGAEVLYQELDMPLLYTLHDEARAEGGDLLWVDHDTLAVGLGFRTNAEGLRQLREALTEIGVEVIPVELPYYTGPEACLHLLSLISIVDHRTAVVYPPLLAVPFWQKLQQRGFQLIEVPDAEFATMGPNVLTLAPRKCLMLEGNPITKRLLEEAGCEVMTYSGNEISLKAEGGPTCLTRPIWRDHA
jgi:dimethylargininase